MTVTLKVTPEELRSTAAAFASCGSEVKNNTAQMLALVAGISQSVWSGASSASYLNKFQALGADILPLEFRDVFGGVAENAAELVSFQNDGRAFHIDFQCILLADIQRPAHLDREHDPSQFIHLSDNSR